MVLKQIVQAIEQNTFADLLSLVNHFSHFISIPDRQDFFSQVARRVKGHRRSVFRLQTIFSRGQDERQNLRLSILRFGV